jgi:predicted transglutaminase-like cysteine proteinase
MSRAVVRMRWSVGSLLVLAALFASIMPASAGSSYSQVLGSKFVASTNFTVKLTPIPLWDSMLDRWQNGAACKADAKGLCTTVGWKEAIAAGQGKSGVEQLKAINDAFNKNLSRYGYDKDVYQVGDYWATPYQLLARGGDCEDFAIAKYMALKALGFPEQNMVIVTVMRKLQRDGHAILVVFLGSDGYVLDILNTHVVNQSAAAVSYMPLMGINAQRWLYLHKIT